MTRMLKNLQNLTTLLTLLLLSYAASAELVAKVDRSVLDSNETLRLELRYDSQVFRGEPDVSALSSDFEVLSNNRQQSYSSVNGKTQSFTAWTLQLRPKRVGILLIPSFNFKGDISNAIELRVRAAPVNPTAANPGSQPIYTETLVDSESIFVNQQLILTHRLYTSINLRDFSLSELKIDNALLHRLGDTTYQKIINNRTYLVLEVKYAIFPESIGLLKIPALRFGAFEVNSQSQFGVFNNRGNQVIRDTQAKSVTVLPQPSSASTNGWMPSKNVSLEQRWSGSLNNITVGEPITRTMTITARGLSASQITPLDTLQSDNYRSYPDQPQLNQQMTDSDLISTRIESLAIVPNSPGKIVLPAIELPWWNTDTGRQEVARLAAVILEVKPSNVTVDLSSNELLAPDVTNSNTPALPQAENIQEQMLVNSLSLTLNAFLIIALVLVFIYRRKNYSARRHQHLSTDKTPALLTLKQQLKNIHVTAKEDNLVAMREAIIIWGATLFADQNPSTLRSLASCLQDNDIALQFEQLDRHLYRTGEASNHDLDVNLLFDRLKKYSSFDKEQRTPNQRRHELRDLYPK
ncbi:MAG TPA: hypothetical protein DCX08_01415 [Porticoccaceae bacterium]|nr:hypothetical protein [Porticoccaceae bacterium]